MTTKAAKKSAPAPKKSSAKKHPITLAIDIGGSHLKAMLLDAHGRPASERQRTNTPTAPTVQACLRALDELIKPLAAFDRVSVGYPGVVKEGVAMTAANLHPWWIHYPLAKELAKRWKKPVRVANDADVQGYGAITGQGAEMVVTLGTGTGSALFVRGRLYPNLELGHHPWRKKTYEDYLGRRGLKMDGRKRWNKLLEAAIEQWRATYNWDHLYLGGGETARVDFKPPKGVSIVSNDLGLLGGAALWREQ
jgi:polyphosphate glucokinase